MDDPFEKQLFLLKSRRFWSVAALAGHRFHITATLKSNRYKKKQGRPYQNMGLGLLI